MLAVLEKVLTMPDKAREKKGTTHVRLFTDLAEMIGWIVRVEKKTGKDGAAQLLDPMIRAQVTARYNKYLPHIQKLKQMQAQLKKAEEEAATAVKKSGRPAE